MGITAPSGGATCLTLHERMHVTGGGPLLAKVAKERNTRTAFTPQANRLPKRRTRVRRIDKNVSTAEVGGRNQDAPIQLAWLNIRGLRSKDELLVRTAREQQWPLVLLTETKLPREQERLFSGERSSDEWSWILGSGQALTRTRAPSKGGVGALVHHSIRGAIQKLDSTREQLWLRLDPAVAPGSRPTFIGVVYLPSGDSAAIRADSERIYEELAARVQKYQSQGAVILGGDMNARLAANGDSVTNAAGNRLAEFSQRNGLRIANLPETAKHAPLQAPPLAQLPPCTGQFSRSELRTDGLQQSTVDYVLVSTAAQPHVASLRICESVPERVLSDHKPLIVEWRGRLCASAAQAPESAARVKWRVDDICADRKAKARMQAHMQRTMTQWQSDSREWMSTSQYQQECSPQERVTTLLGTWEHQLNHSLAATIGTKQVKPRSKSWIKGGNLLRLIQKRNTLRAQCEHAATKPGQSDCEPPAPQPDTILQQNRWDSLATQALEAQRAVRKEIHRRKRAQREETFASVEREWSHPKLFFHRVKQMRSAGSTTAGGISSAVLSTTTGERKSDLTSRLDITRQHYASLGTDERMGREQRSSVKETRPTAEAVESAEKRPPEECISPEDGFDELFARRIEQRVAEMQEESLREAAQPMDQTWTEAEMSAALKRLRNNKAPGADSIHAEFLRYGGEALHSSLLLLFQTIYEQEVWPDRWSLGLICPIYKRSGDESSLDNYRPITLLSIVSKLFEILLNTRLMEWAEANRVLCDEQGGFRTKRGCADQLFVLKEVWSSRRERKLPTYAAFLDAKSAYDRVWRTGLWHQLFQCGVRGRAWRMIRAMYDKMQRVALVDGQRTEMFPVEVGVSQGSVLSPFLYSVFIDGLIRRLKSDPSLGVQIAAQQLVGLLYADDIVLLAPNPRILQKMLDVTTEYAQQWRFHFNGRKSQIVVQGSKHERAVARSQTWRLDGNELAVVEEYKYLGMESGLPPGRSPHTSFCQRIVHSCTHRAHDLLLAGCEMNQLQARCSNRLWSALCRPILEYGAEVWRPNQGQTKELERVQGWYARRVLGCSPSTPAVFATSELGMRSLELRREQDHLRYWRRLCAALPERLLHAVFRQRVRDAKADPHLSRHSLCAMLYATLSKYNLEEQWDSVATDQLYSEEEWEGLIRKRVEEEEATQRQVTLAAKSSLDGYSKSLLPPLGTMAGYLQGSARNCEGVWIRCRLRSDTLPLMPVLARHCQPPRRESAHSRCSLCAGNSEEESAETTAGQAETATHFLSSCSAPQMVELRAELCRRLQRSLQEWQEEQLAAADAEWEGLCLSPAAEANIRAAREAALLTKSGLESIRAIVAGVQRKTQDQQRSSATQPLTSAHSAEADTERRVWSELLMGRTVDPQTSQPWSAPLLQKLDAHCHNFLLLAWRARAELLGGVPTLMAAGRSIALQPYRRMKCIGVRAG